MLKVYLISTGDEEKRYKIGHTRRKVEDRIREFKTGNSSSFEIIGVFESKFGTKIESTIHRKFGSKKIEGEWFFLNDNDVSSFESECKRLHDIFHLLTTENTYVMKRGLS